MVCKCIYVKMVMRMFDKDPVCRSIGCGYYKTYGVFIGKVLRFCPFICTCCVEKRDRRSVPPNRYYVHGKPLDSYWQIEVKLVAHGLPYTPCFHLPNFSAPHRSLLTHPTTPIQNPTLAPSLAPSSLATSLHSSKHFLIPPLNSSFSVATIILSP